LKSKLTPKTKELKNQKIHFYFPADFKSRQKLLLTSYSSQTTHQTNTASTATLTSQLMCWSSMEALFAKAAWRFTKRWWASGDAIQK